LLTVLEALGATPASRARMKDDPTQQAPTGLAKLRAVRSD
jgi:hypothetical protein